MDKAADVIEQSGEKVPGPGAETPAWQDQVFMAKVQKIINGEECTQSASQSKLLTKIKASIEVVQNIKAATQKATQQIQEASLQAERAEGQTQGYLSVLRDLMDED